MSYKSILAAFVANDPRNEAVAKAAAQLAAAHNAHLTGLHMTPPIALPVYAAVPVPGDLLDSYYEDAGADARETGGVVEEACSAVGATSREWRAESGPVVACLKDAAPFADIVVLAQHQGGEYGWIVGEAALTLGVPVLAVPEAGAFNSFGQSILLAWKPSRECTRAVRDAMPMLRAADRVIVLRANAEDDGLESEIGAHLARHGVKVDVKDITIDEVSVGNAVLNMVVDENCDTVVMGAYGHSRMREYVFGGATRLVLESMTVPTLLSH